jgi:hypothetical protein
MHLSTRIIFKFMENFGFGCEPCWVQRQPWKLKIKNLLTLTNKIWIYVFIYMQWSEVLS